MIKIVLLFVLSQLLTILCVWGQNCTSIGLKRFDSNIAKLITIGNFDRSFPENKGQDLKKYCDENSKLINRIDSYKKRCLSGVSQRSAHVLIFAIRNTIKRLCHKDSQQLNKLILATPCANLGNLEINKCNNRLIDSFLGVINEPDHTKRLPMTCCEYYKLFPCIENGLQNVTQCSESQVDTITDFARGIVGNLVNLLCTEYTEGSDMCANLGSPPDKRKDQRRTKSFAIPMIEIFKSFV